MKKSFVIILAVVLLTALAVSAYATEFAPSVELKPAPEVAEEVVIVDAEGKPVTDIKAEDITVAAVTDAEELPAAEAETLTKAFDALKEQDLTKVCANFEEVLKTAAPAAAAENFVVRDVVNVSGTPEVAKYLETEGNKLALTFKMDLKQDARLIVMVYTADGWQALDPELVEIQPDGSVKVLLATLGPVAFVVEKS